MAKAKIYQFTVEGEGAFPYDMLRYDQCWPYESIDATSLSLTDHIRRRIVLERFSEIMPTTRRWESFHWRIVELGYPDEDTRKVGALEKFYG